MLNNIIIIWLLVTTTTIVKCDKYQSKLKFDIEEQNSDDEACFTLQNGIEVKGKCMLVQNCPSVLSNVLNRLYNHTVCGYEGTKQIICCPNTNDDNNQLDKRIDLTIDLSKSLECVVPDSNVTGVIKFLSDCPALKQQDPTIYLNKLCEYEVCSDLVCCPDTSRARLKKVCSEVDTPIETLQVRLRLNQECTVKELNLTGRFLQRCEYVDRNPHLASMLNNVCNNYFECKYWYCCPIEEDDHFHCSSSTISSSQIVLVGPKCVDSKSGRPGTCKRSWDCLGVDYLTLDSCGSYCCSNYYCCPENEILPNQPISARECLSYTKHLSKAEVSVPINSYINTTICSGAAYAAGGIVVSPGDFPHMAALGYELNNEILWNCGGSLISNRFVLTAAHCLSNRNVGDVKKVRLGVIDLLNDEDTADCPEEYDVAKIIPHPEYNPKLVYNDIGLIELVDQVTYNFHIRPICLPTSSDVPKHYESMGWGALGESADKSVKLIKVHQVLFSYEECQEQYSYHGNRRLNRGILNDTHICAGSKTSIQSTCAGDSGGPLVAQHETYIKLFYIYGIVSFGTACGFANSPGVYTKVFPYVKWIESIVWSN